LYSPDRPRKKTLISETIEVFFFKAHVREFLLCLRKWLLVLATLSKSVCLELIAFVSRTPIPNSVFYSML